jgi:hypothetical protein
MRTTCTTKITLATNCQEKDKNSKELLKQNEAQTLDMETCQVHRTWALKCQLHQGYEKSGSLPRIVATVPLFLERGTVVSSEKSLTWHPAQPETQTTSNSELSNDVLIALAKPRQLDRKHSNVVCNNICLCQIIWLHKPNSSRISSLPQ